MLNVLTLAQCSAAAYDGKQAFYDLGFNDVGQICSQTTSCYVYAAHDYTNKESVISFRGTEGWKDIWTDVKRFRINTKDGWFVHEGFLDRWNSIAEEVIHLIRRAPDGHSFSLTGHSLGGALASLAMVYKAPQKAKSLPSSMVRTITFGQPKVGGKNIAKILDEAGVIRYANEGDLVTCIPTIGYKHGGKELVLPGWASHDYGWWKIIKNHSIDDYILRLERLGFNIEYPSPP